MQQYMRQTYVIRIHIIALNVLLLKYRIHKCTNIDIINYGCKMLLVFVHFSIFPIAYQSSLIQKPYRMIFCLRSEIELTLNVIFP